jgi:hypothetical protein
MTPAIVPQMEVAFQHVQRTNAFSALYRMFHRETETSGDIGS